MKLSDIMVEIKTAKTFADAEVTENPRETLGGRLARQKRAKEDLKALTETYRQALLRSAIFVLVTGSNRDELVKTISEKYGFFAADSNKFYSDITDAISPTLYNGRESSPNLLDVVTRVLENKALEVGIVGYPLVTFKQEYRRVINSRSEMQSLVKEVIDGQVGTEVVGVQAAKSVLNDAINAGHSGNTTPILLAVEDADGRLINGLRTVGRQVCVLHAEGAIDDEVVSAAMENLKSAVLGSPNEVIQRVTVSAAVEKKTDDGNESKDAAPTDSAPTDTPPLETENSVEAEAAAALAASAAIAAAQETKPTTNRGGNKRGQNNKNSN